MYTGIPSPVTTWLKGPTYVCPVTHVCMSRHPSMYVPSPTYVCPVTHVCMSRHPRMYVPSPKYVCPVTHVCMSCQPRMYVPSPMYVCPVTHVCISLHSLTIVCPVPPHHVCPFILSRWCIALLVNIKDAATRQHYYNALFPNFFWPFMHARAIE